MHTETGSNRDSDDRELSSLLRKHLGRNSFCTQTKQTNKQTNIESLYIRNAVMY